MIKLNEGEEVVEVIRKHWFLPLVHTINLTFIFLLPALLIFVLISNTISSDIVDVQVTFGKPSFLVFGFSLWGLVLWLRFFSFWTDHHLDGWIVTNKRIIDVEQHGFFRREIASFRLERLQDVTTEQKGILATILKFGSVHVQTAGADKEFILNDAKKPKIVRGIILAQYDKLIDKNPNLKPDVDGVNSAT